MANSKITDLGALTAATGDEIPVNRAGSDGKITAGAIVNITGSTAYATRALDNLSAVAINTDLLLGTSDGGALGSTSKMWSDLFLASGAVINFNAGDVTLTHASGALQISSASQLGWSTDLILTRKGAANLALGAADAASPVAQILSVQNVVGGTTDTAGVDFTISGSRGTGTGAGGKIVFKTAAAAGGSASTQNALATAAQIDSAGFLYSVPGLVAGRSIGLELYTADGSVLSRTLSNRCIRMSDGANGIRISSNYLLHWSSNNSGSGDANAVDTYLGRQAAANIRLGLADAASPVAQTLSVQNVVAGTSDTAGANFTIAASRGTGTGISGKIIFQTAPHSTTGSSQNALSSAWAFDDNLQFVPQASMSTTMTQGFSNIVGAAGAATGTPGTTTGFPMYYDSTNNQIYVYNGAWKKTAALT